jgi:hypothetical protein
MADTFHYGQLLKAGFVDGMFCFTLQDNEGGVADYFLEAEAKPVQRVISAAGAYAGKLQMDEVTAELRRK